MQAVAEPAKKAMSAMEKNFIVVAVVDGKNSTGRHGFQMAVFIESTKKQETSFRLLPERAAVLTWRDMVGRALLR